MPNPNISTQDWYYDAPGKKSTSVAKEPPPASQIPGLSHGIEEQNEMEERQFRRKWIRDTDSKYIKLAKGGGRKNLLTIKDPPSERPEEVDYPRVDWFDHYNPEPENYSEFSPAPPPMEMPRSKRMMPHTEPHRVLPEWYVHEDNDKREEKESLSDPNFSQSNGKKNFVSFDNMSAWEREAKEEAESKNCRHVKLPPIHNKVKQEKNKKVVQQFPKRFTTNRAPKIESEPVDFQHLMSMGYQKDWFDDQHLKHQEERKKLQVERQKNDQKKSTQLREAIEMRKPKYCTTQEEDRQMFKLSRFQNVPPRVESFRT